MRVRIILRILGLLAMLLGTIMLIPGLVSAIYREPLGVVAFGISAVLAISVGLVMKHFGVNSDMSRKDAFAAVSFGWLLAGLIGALPYLLLGMPPVDAFFESTSGFTTTGATILSEYNSDNYWILSQDMVQRSFAYVFTERAVNQLINWSTPDSIELPFGRTLDILDLLTIKGTYFGLLFWRSFSQFLGGMGIILLFIAILPNLGVAGRELYSVEGLGLTKESLTPRVKNAAKAFWGIYLGLTGLESLLLIAAGIPVYDSLCTSFSSISTAGFSPLAFGIAEYDSILVEAIICIFLLIGGTNFIIYHQIILKRDLNVLIRDGEFRFYIFIMIASVVLLVLFVGLPGDLSSVLLSAVFQVVSTMTTTGFVNNFDYNFWSLAAKLILILLMIIGGCTGSTGGGIKVERVLIVLKYVHSELIRSLHPKAVIPIRVADKVVKESTVKSVLLFVQLYVLIFVLATIVFAITESSNSQFGALSAISAAACSLGIIGPGFGVVAMNFTEVSDAGRILGIFLMYIGRLEILPVVLMLLPDTWSE